MDRFKLYLIATLLLGVIVSVAISAEPPTAPTLYTGTTLPEDVSIIRDRTDVFFKIVQPAGSTGYRGYADLDGTRPYTGFGTSYTVPYTIPTGNITTGSGYQTIQFTQVPITQPTTFIAFTAYDSSGNESDYSTAFEIPTMPRLTNFSANAVNEAQINLTWNIENITNGAPENITFNIYRGLAANSLSFLKSITGTSGTYNYSDPDSGLAENTTYHYKIWASKTTNTTIYVNPLTSSATTQSGQINCQYDIDVQGNQAWTGINVAVNCPEIGSLQPGDILNVQYLNGEVCFSNGESHSCTDAAGYNRAAYETDFVLDDAAYCLDPLGSDSHAGLMYRWNSGGSVFCGAINQNLTVPSSGALLDLGINDCSLTGSYYNTGSFTVRITITRN